jgi:hypothetical protein
LAYLASRQSEPEAARAVWEAMTEAEAASGDVGGRRWGMMIGAPEPYFSQIPGPVWNLSLELSGQDRRPAREVVARMEAIARDLNAQWLASRLCAPAPK